ncbi:unnamed protein product [Effrenium voratum]|nr:unnamed protein product [Effrenium voratum]|mmetsp:Transcript_103921/g.247347  ORF Transcript_103921/g.247347 Transcript_103921/m.247347 type:complete len:417 (-) Transcript_103921:80-1330(-)
MQHPMRFQFRRAASDQYAVGESSSEWKGKPRASTVPDFGTNCESERGESSEEEHFFGMCERHRAVTLPSESANELMQLFPQDEQGFEPSFGNPFRHSRRPSKTKRQRDRVFLDLAERLRSNDFEFVAQREAAAAAAAAAEAAASKPELGPVFALEETAIIFDWDDTLFPTWFVTEVVNPCLEDVHCERLPTDSPFVECLTSQGQAVEDLLRCARSCGHVGIVTLAQKPWVLNSAAKYLPGLDLPGLLEELHIPVIYARECLKRYVIQEGMQDGACLWTLAKQAGMRKVLRFLYGRDRPWMNVLSIGDSTVERTAIMELMWSSQHEEDASGRLPCCKTIKLMDDPSVEQLHTQLIMLSMWMVQLSQHGQDFDFSLDDSDASIHKQFAVSPSTQSKCVEDVYSLSSDSAPPIGDDRFR